MFFRTESFQQFIRYYPIVTAIIVIQVLFLLATTLPLFPSNWVFENLAGINLFVAEGEVWRLVTPIFLHSGFAHLLFNSFSLVLFGPPLEQMLGKTKFLLVYLAGGILANIATYFLHPLTYTHVGSSGAIFALFGYYVSIILFKKHMLSQQNSQIILSITAIGLIMTFLQPNINVTAHVFGLLSGLLIGALFYYDKNTKINIPRPSGRNRVNINSVPPKTLFIWGILLILALVGLLSR
jgi:rhomboid protease GluP